MFRFVTAASTMLGSYLSGGMNLIAFRLTKGNAAGTIRPIRMTYASERPMIPIRPTAVAANDDMGVMVWVLGESRAVTVNYKTLELNESLINWLNGGQRFLNSQRCALARCPNHETRTPRQIPRLLSPCHIALG